MSINNDIPGVEIFGKGRMEFELPCGYVDAAGSIHNTVVLKEMTGVEEDIMDDDKVSVTTRITNLLSSCCEKLGTIEDKAVIKAAIGDTLSDGMPLTAADRIAMLLFLRRVSVGDTYKFEKVCPHCERLNNNRQLRLDKLEIKKMKFPAKRRVQVTLPRSGKEAILRVLTAKGEEAISKLSGTQKDSKSLAIIARLERLGGNPVTANDVLAVKNLPTTDRLYLGRVYNAIEGAVDTDIEIECLGCKQEFTFPLDLGQIFFSNQDEKITDQDFVWL